MTRIKKIQSVFPKGGDLLCAHRKLPGRCGVFKIYILVE